MADAKPSSDKPSKQPAHMRDLFREACDTVVFVLSLVLLLKLFVAEAFVIPTGSMATTLWGNHVICACRSCAFEFEINNASPENGPDQGRLIEGYCCPNCGYEANGVGIEKDLGSPSSGDRVLVSKYIYHIREPRRFEVPVFKYPVEPYHPADQTGMNYIKRLVGLPGETIVIYCGDLYVCTDIDYPSDVYPRPQNPLDNWRFEYTYHQVDRGAEEEVARDKNGRGPNERGNATDAFRSGKFTILRKPPEQILSMRRIVFDLDYQPTMSGLTDKQRKRWHPVPGKEAGWRMEDKGFKHEGDEEGLVRYQHLDPFDNGEGKEKPYFINDYLGYNFRRDRRVDPTTPFKNDGRWVPDLTVECTAEFEGPGATLTLDLSKGPERFQARFADGKCTLVHITPSGEQEMGSQPTKIEKGKYKLRFANVDCRLTVWVDDKVLPFGPEADYAAPSPVTPFKPVPVNDEENPVLIGAKGNVRCSSVRLWRDTYYTCDQKNPPRDGSILSYYVQPGTYLCFGDNSNSSSDGRTWGLVPERLMLGRAVAIYWPLWRIRVIR